MKNRRGTALGGAAGSPASPKHWGRGHGREQSLHCPLAAAAQPLPRAHGRHRALPGELPWGTQHCSLPQPSAPLWALHTPLTWFFTGVTKFPFFLQSIESGYGPELRRKLPLVAEQFCKPGRRAGVGCQPSGPRQPPSPGWGLVSSPHTLGTAAGSPGQPRRAQPACSAPAAQGAGSRRDSSAGGRAEAAEGEEEGSPRS